MNRKRLILLAALTLIVASAYSWPEPTVPEYALPYFTDLMEELQGGCDNIFALAFVAPFWGIAYLCGIDGFGGYTKLILIIVGIISITYHIATEFHAFITDLDGDEW